MKKMYVVSPEVTPEEIISIARRYLLSEDFEVQDALDDKGNLCIQGKKTNLLRKVSGTDYAIQLQVEHRADGSYVLNAGWGQWLSKVVTGGIYTFVAFGFMIVPVIVGSVTQKKLPQKLLDEIQDKLMLKYPESHIYMEARS